MYELVSEHEVHARIHVGLGPKVLAVVPGEGHVDAVVLVQHGRHTVKPGGGGGHSMDVTPSNLAGGGGTAWTSHHQTWVTAGVP